MTAYDDGLTPTRDKTWNARDDNGFSENSSSSIYQVIKCLCPLFISFILMILVLALENLEASYMVEQAK